MNEIWYEGKAEFVGGPAELEADAHTTLWRMTADGPQPIARLSIEREGQWHLYQVERYPGDTENGPWRYRYVEIVDAPAL